MKDSILLTPKGDRLEFEHLDNEIELMPPVARIRRSGFLSYDWHYLNEQKVFSLVLLGIRFLKSNLKFLKQYKIKTEKDISNTEKQLEDIKSIFFPTKKPVKKKYTGKKRGPKPKKKK